MYYIIDRIIGNTSVCEDEQGNMLEIPLSLLPWEVKEGDCIRSTQSGIYEKDTEASFIRKKTIKNKLKKLFNK